MGQDKKERQLLLAGAGPVWHRFALVNVDWRISKLMGRVLSGTSWVVLGAALLSGCAATSGHRESKVALVSPHEYQRPIISRQVPCIQFEFPNTNCFVEFCIQIRGGGGDTELSLIGVKVTGDRGQVAGNLQWNSGSSWVVAYGEGGAELGRRSFESSLVMFYDSFDKKDPGGAIIENERVVYCAMEYTPRMKSFEVFNDFRKEFKIISK